ncbi:hypothetical protein ECZU51_49380 [Escherichia coli]|nr:hypothetical protein ECZU51_49380 [Escherichia coli]
MMASGIAQALDWMPVQPDAISGIWTAELDREQRAALLSLNQPFIQEALMYELDAFLGRSDRQRRGCPSLRQRWRQYNHNTPN